MGPIGGFKLPSNREELRRARKKRRPPGPVGTPGEGKHKRPKTGGFAIDYGACPKACRHTQANGCKTYRKRCADRGSDPVKGGPGK